MMVTIEQRLQALERDFRQSRRANRLLSFLVVVIVCIAGAQGSSPDTSKPTIPEKALSPDAGRSDVPLGKDRLRTVEADQFVLLDRSGRSRARMIVTEDGPQLCMFDEKGKKRLELSHANTSSGLRLFDSDESPVVSLQLSENAGRAHLEIRSTQGNSMTDASGFSVRDAANHGRLQFALLNGNFPVLGISQSGQNGPPSIEMTASDETRSVKIHDVDGQPLFSVFAAEDGKTSVNLRHPDHERSLQISTGPKDFDGPAIAFFTPARRDATGGQLPVLQLGLYKNRQPYVRIVDSDGRTTFAAPTNSDTTPASEAQE